MFQQQLFIFKVEVSSVLELERYERSLVSGSTAVQLDSRIGCCVVCVRVFILRVKNGACWQQWDCTVVNSIGYEA